MLRNLFDSLGIQKDIAEDVFDLPSVTMKNRQILWQLITHILDYL